MHLINRPFVHIVLIILLISLTYSNTITAPFEFDDVPNIADNLAIRNLLNFTDISNLDKSNILESVRPLLSTRYIGYLSFALNFAIHGLDVKGFHLVNITIHIINSVLVYVLLQLTYRTPCFQGRNTAVSADSRNFVAVFTALLFAAHPIQTQAVTYIVQRFTSLASLFYLLSLVTYVRFRLASRSSKYNYAFYMLSLALAIIAMKTKEFALLLPVMIALYEFAFFEGGLKKRILHLVPYALTISIIPLSLMGVSASYVSGTDGSVSRVDYLLTQFRVIMTYLRLLIFPVNQNLDYDYPIYRSLFAPEVFLSFLFLVSLLALGIWLYRNSNMGNRFNSWFLIASCGIIWFFISVAPESSIIPIKDVIFEHRMYLPSLGIFLAFVAVTEHLISKWQCKFNKIRNFAVLAMTILLTALSVTTYARNAIWSDEVLFSEDVAKKSPHKARPHYSLGLAYWNHGRIDEAVRAYKTVIKIEPAFSADVYNNLGLALRARGNEDEAIQQYKIALTINPLDPDVHFNLANTYINKNLIAEAVSEYEVSVKCKPDDPKTHYYLAIAYTKLGLIDDASKEYAIVIGLNPQDVAARNNLGNIYKSSGRLDDAMKEYLAALRIKPDFVEARYNLANTYLYLGRINEAKNEYKTTLEFKPDFIEARRQLEKL